MSANCKIIDNDVHAVELEYRHQAFNEQHIYRVPIVIGSDCFIGMNFIILKGMILGDNVMIGVRSVVHGHFPDNVIIVGNTAKIVKYMKV